MSSKASEKRHIALIRMSALGDVAMTLPAIYAAAGANPDVRFTLVTRSPMDKIPMNLPHNLDVVTVRPDSDHRGIIGLWRLTRSLKKAGVTEIVDLHAVIRSRIISLFARLSLLKVTTLKKQRKARRDIIGRRRPLSQPVSPMISLYADTMRRAGIALPEPLPEVTFGNLDATAVADILALAKNARDLIGIAPGARHPGKIYPPELMEQVVANLASRPSTHIYLFGSKDELHLFEQWAERHDVNGNITPLPAYNLGFKRELPLMARLKVMVTMDSANMHLASLVATPVVSIWGATHPALGFTGYRQDAIGTTLQADERLAPCRPCSVYGAKPCKYGDYRCMREVSPLQIIDAVNFHLAGR